MKINRFNYLHIPITTYEKDDNLDKPLIFFFHGFTGSKDKTIMGRGEILANLGFYVVAIDAYLHGERMPDNYKKIPNTKKYEDIIDIAIKTAEDAKMLYHDYFSKLPNIRKNEYYAYGVSMGSLVSFYLATIDKTLKGIATICCFPSFVDYYKEKQQELGFLKDDIYLKRLENYQKLDPLIHYNRLKNVKIFMGVGINDTVVNPKFAQELKTKLETAILNHYMTGHISTKEMLTDSFSYIKSFANL